MLASRPSTRELDARAGRGGSNRSHLSATVLALQDSRGEQDGVKGRRLANEQSVGEEVKDPKDDQPSTFWGGPVVFLFLGGG